MLQALTCTFSLFSRDPQGVFLLHTLFAFFRFLRRATRLRSIGSVLPIFPAFAFVLGRVRKSPGRRGPLKEDQLVPS